MALQTTPHFTLDMDVYIRYTLGRIKQRYTLAIGSNNQNFQVGDQRPFLRIRNNLFLKLNLYCFNLNNQTQYRVGVLIPFFDNLPRAERYELENMIITGTIPGPKAPKQHIYMYLKHFVDELLELWKIKVLTKTTTFTTVQVKCALSCIACVIPATRKLCGLLGCSAKYGCSKCRKRFPCAQFGQKSIMHHSTESNE